MSLSEQQIGEVIYLANLYNYSKARPDAIRDLIRPHLEFPESPEAMNVAYKQIEARMK